MTNVTDNRIPTVIRRVLIAWLAGASAFRLLLPKESRSFENGLTADSARYLIFFLAVAAVFALLFLLKLPEKAERWAPAMLFVILSAEGLIYNFSWALLVGCGLILWVLIIYGLFGWQKEGGRRKQFPQNHPAAVWVLASLAAVFFLIVSGWTVCRVMTFSSPTFDMGIFSQMFHHMRTTGLPNTTVERDGLLSHFAVHVSPVYYLMLPFYCLVPKPWMLQVLQAAVLSSAVIPLWYIGKNRGLSSWLRVGLCAILLLYPAYSGGTGYDIHENCFLTPLLLWLFYALEKRNGLLTAVFSVLTLAVKEDAAVYVAVVGLWFAVSALPERRWKDLLLGMAIFAGAAGWFLVVTGYLSEQGDGVMSWRYDNFSVGAMGSLASVVASTFLSPVKVVYECVDREKWLYILQTMLPLLGLPLVTRKFHRYILLIPYLLVNLMSDYTYQHHVFFQYGFGSTACLIYLTALNLADMNPRWRVRELATMAMVLTGIVCFCTWILPTAVFYPRYYWQNADYYNEIRDVLDQIPEDTPVTATTFYTTHLSDREVLYDVRYSSREHLLSTDYVVLSVGESDSYQKYGGYDRLVKLLEGKGYRKSCELDGTLVIYAK